MDFADGFQSSSLDPCAVRKTYFATSIQANRLLFPARESFGQGVADASIKYFIWPAAWRAMKMRETTSITV